MMEKNICLSSSEWIVMERLWEKAPKTMMQLVRELKETTGWAKSTTTTMLSRMEAKGLIYYAEGEKARKYYPCVDRNFEAVQETENLLKRIFDGDVCLLVQAIVDRMELSKAEIREMIEVLQFAEAKAK
jgi:BlaI family penicillinase repressor